MFTTNHAKPLDLPFSALSFMKSLPALRRWLLLALLLLTTSCDAAVAICVKEGDVEGVAVGREEQYKLMHGHVKMETEEEDYSEDYLGDVMESVDFPDDIDDDEDSDGVSRGSGKRYLRLLRGHGVVLCPHLQEYLERLGKKLA